VTFRALAAGLGCSPMTPYRYFKNKNEIFAAVRTVAYREFALSQEAACDTSLAPLPRITRLGQDYVQFGAEHPYTYQLMFALRQPQPDDYPELRAAELRAWTPMRASVQAAVDAGDLPGDAEEIAHVLWSGVHGLMSLHLAGKLFGPKLPALVDPMIETLMVGVRARTEANGGAREECLTSQEAGPASEPTTRQTAAAPVHRSVPPPSHEGAQ
jgi:AcrR family transcriptional regulator